MTEAEHALSLLRDVSADWEGGRSVLPIDPTCGFRPVGQLRCGASLASAVVLLDKGGTSCHVVAVCAHHAEIMESAIQKWRSMQ